MLARVSFVELTRAVVEHSSAVPCVRDPGPWVDPQGPGDVAEALVGCGWCPVLDVCRVAAESAEPRTSGVTMGGAWWPPGFQRRPSERAPKILRAVS